MEVLHYHARPSLRRPLLVVAFRGFNDHAETGVGAAEYLRQAWDGEMIASLDPEEFYDFTVVRPTVSLSEEGVRQISWPSTQLYAAAIPGQDRDALILTGVEPSLRWRTFCEAVMAYAHEAGVGMTVTLGAFPAAVPHSRPVRVRGSAASKDVADRLSIPLSRYRGRPTGLSGVMTDFCRREGIDAVSLLALMPHYVTAGPSPKGATALLRRLESLAEVSIDTEALERDIPDFESRVESAVGADPEAAAYVRMLEQQADERTQQQQELPSGDDLAAEFERFLRERED